MPEVRLEEVNRFMVDSLKAVGTPDSEAREHAALLLHADTTGHFSHGLNRLELYINDCLTGAAVPTAKPTILKEAAGTAWVDGCNALGATVGNFCMDVAMKKAREAGIGLVSAKRCNHFGMAGYWAQKAERQGLIGMAFTNSSPVMVATRAKNSSMGTNPISMFAPATGGDSLGVDLACTTVAMGKVEVQIHKEEPIPYGWALGPDGKPTTDAKLAFETGRLMPLGGFEENSGYKGYALSALVEVLCSGLSGANATYQVRSWSLDSEGGPPNLGQCFIVINPAVFAPAFEERLAGCLHSYRNQEPVDPSKPVLAPGDKELKNAEETKNRGTVIYAKNMIESYNVMAKKLGVAPMKVV